MSAMRMPASAMARTTSSRNTRTWCSMLGPTCLVMASRVSDGVQPSEPRVTMPASTWSRRPDTRTMKNSSRLEEKMARYLSRSSSGTSGSAAMARTRSLNCSQEISRLMYRYGSYRSRSTASGTLAVSLTAVRLLARVLHRSALHVSAVPASRRSQSYVGTAGFPLHGHLPGKLGLMVGSTGVLRLPATLGDVLRELGKIAGGIQVAVENHAAGLADEGVLGQGELGFHPSAGRAGPGRGIEAVGDDQPAAIPGRLVGELAADLRQTSIGNGAGKAPIADHSADIEALDYHRAVFGGEGRSQSMEGVAADVGRPGMDTGEPSVCLLPAFRPGFAASKLTIQPSQLPECVLQRAGVGDHRSVGEHGQLANADVNPDHRPPGVDREVPLDLDGEGNTPAIGGSTDGGGQDAGASLLQAAGHLAGGLVGLEHPDPWKLDVLAVAQDLDLAGGEPAGIPR